MFLAGLEVLGVKLVVKAAPSAPSAQKPNGIFEWKIRRVHETVQNFGSSFMKDVGINPQ